MSRELRELIFRMVAENPTWGAPHIPSWDASTSRRPAAPAKVIWTLMKREAGAKTLKEGRSIDASHNAMVVYWSCDKKTSFWSSPSYLECGGRDGIGLCCR